MKKIFTVLIGVMITMVIAPSVKGEIVFTDKSFESHPKFIPYYFTKGGTAQLAVREREYLESEHEWITSGYSIYDENFDKIKEINIPQYPEVSATYKWWKAIEKPTEALLTNVSEYNYSNGIYDSKTFKTMCVSGGYSVIEETADEIRYLPSSERYYDYYDYEYFGTKYPNIIFVWKKSEDEGYQRILYYEHSGWEFAGYEEEPSEETDSRRPSIKWLYVDIESGAEIEDCQITQCLFNSDNSYEWIIPTWTTIPYNTENEHGKTEGERISTIGFKVISEDNTVVADVSFPENYCYFYGDGTYQIYIAGDKKYLLTEVHDINDENYAYIVYAISSENGSVCQVGEPIKTHVSPTAPRRGTPVSVDLGISNDRGCTVEVISANGSKVLNRNLKPGVTDTEISTDNFAPGMYIVNVISGSSKHEATKIIVR